MTSQKKLLGSLAKATPEQRAAIYEGTLGLRITYHHDEPGWATVEARPACVNGRVGGAFDPSSTPAVLKGKVQLRAA